MNHLDSQGRRISILNDEKGLGGRPSLNYLDVNRARFQSSSAISTSSSSNPPTPGLQRSTSQDSAFLGRTPSPVTPHQLGMDRLTLHAQTLGGYPQQPSKYGDPELYTPITPYAHLSYDQIPRTIATSESQQAPPRQLQQSQLPQQQPLPQQQQQQQQISSSSVPYRSRRAPVKSLKNTHPCPLASQFGCERYFTTSGHAARHAKIHSGEKSVQCPECPKTFARKDNMDQHRKTHNRLPKQQSSRPRLHAAASDDGRSARKIRKQLSRVSRTPERLMLVTSGESNESTSLSPESSVFQFSRERSGSGSGLDVLANVASAMT